MANSIFQTQLMQQYKQFRQNPMQFLASRNMNVPMNAMSDPKALFEQMTGQKIPQEYANNPYGYLQMMTNNMPQQQSNPLMSMAQMFMK